VERLCRSEGRFVVGEELASELNNADPCRGCICLLKCVIGGSGARGDNDGGPVMVTG
jgi:hypothetical protein